MDVYTLKSCDTCRKALSWLQSENITANNFDIRIDGISKEVIAAAVSALGWEKVLNRRSTTWRNLSQDIKQSIDAEKAVTLIVENPTLMKRPLFVFGDDYSTGFDKTVQAHLRQITS